MPGGKRWKPEETELTAVGILVRIIDETGRGERARLSRTLGISEPQLSKYLTGKKSMTYAEFDALCRALGREPWEVMRDAEST